VNTDALTTALAEILRANPHYAADGEGRKQAGDADTRKGEAAKGDLESMTVEDHIKEKYPEKK
jgi:hypothetical protein